MKNREFTRSFQEYISKWGREKMADYCKDVDAKSYCITVTMLKEFDFDYAEHKGIVIHLTSQTNTPKRTL
jgi:hypothetical protein